MKKAFFISILSLLSACAEKENLPEQKQPSAGTIAQVSTSTASAMAAPATYIKNTVGAIGQAKEAASLMEKTQQDRLNAAEGK